MTLDASVGLAHFVLGAIHLNNGEFEAAIREASLAIALDLPPAYRPNAFYLRARVYEVRGFVLGMRDPTKKDASPYYELAIQDYGQAIALDPEDADHYRARAVLEDRLGRGAAAAADREAASRIAKALQ